MFRSMSKNNRALGLIALMALASFTVLGTVYSLTTHETDQITAEVARLTDLRTMAQQLAVAVRDEEASLNAYVLSRSTAAERQFADALAIETDTVNRLNVAAAEFPRVEAWLGAMDVASRGWRARVAQPALAAVARNDTAAMNVYASQAGDTHVQVDSAVDAIDNELILAANDLTAQRAVVAMNTNVGALVALGFLIFAFGFALLVVRRFGHALEVDARQSSVLNRFTELASFAVDDHDVATANLAALARLVRPDASVTHILNRSMDRAVPEATTGDAIAEMLPLRALSRCAGVIRGTLVVSDDLADDLSVHCPIYPAATGTLACVPLISGESVGAVHLYWTRPKAIPHAARATIARITEHAALAIGNRRLLAALHGQANTDARTSLANSRAFDTALEAALAVRGPDETVSVLMIDVDHFKKFNDRNGHPAGDVALRTFGEVLQSCLREGDLAARYGGEEFAVYLRGQDAAVAMTVAERIRARTESTIISLAPGMTDRITVSIGLAIAPDQALDRVTLLRLADEALYRAKETGRNRVVGMTEPVSAPEQAGPPERHRRGAAATKVDLPAVA
jgi:diguanylate cyclase (GGDEF)-like protein